MLLNGGQQFLTGLGELRVQFHRVDAHGKSCFGGLTHLSHFNGRDTRFNRETLSCFLHFLNIVID